MLLESTSTRLLSNSNSFINYQNKHTIFTIEKHQQQRKRARTSEILATVDHIGNMACTRRRFHWRKLTKFVIIISIMRVYTLVTCLNQNLNSTTLQEHNHNNSSSSSPSSSNKLASKIQSATQTSKLMNNTIYNQSTLHVVDNDQFNLFDDFPLDFSIANLNWLNLSSLLFDEDQQNGSNRVHDSFIKNIQKNFKPFNDKRPSSHHFIDELIQIFIEEDPEQDDSSSSRNKKHRSKRENSEDVELLHNVVNVPVGSRLNHQRHRRVNRELVKEDTGKNNEPRIIESVYPQRNITHMEMNSDNNGAQDQGHLFSSPNSIYKNSTGHRIKLSGSSQDRVGKGGRRKHWVTHSPYSTERPADPSNSADSYTSTSSTSSPNIIYTTNSLANSLGNPLSVDANDAAIQLESSRALFDGTQEPIDESNNQQPDNPVSGENEIDRSTSSSDSDSVDLFTQAYATTKRPKARRAANLTAPPNLTLDQAQLSSPLPILTTHLPSQDQNQAKGSNLATALDNIMPQVGDELVVDHSGKKNQENLLVDTLLDQNKLEQLLRLFENDAIAKKSKKPNKGSQVAFSEPNNYQPSSHISSPNIPYQQHPTNQAHHSTYSQAPNIDLANNDLRLSNIHNALKSNAPYAALNHPEATSQSEYSQQPSTPPRYHIDSSEPPQTTAPPMVGLENGAPSHVRYPTPASMYSTSLNNAFHQPNTPRLRLSPEATHQLEENFYNTNPISNKRIVADTYQKSSLSHNQQSLPHLHTKGANRYPSLLSPITQYWHSTSKLLNSPNYQAMRNEPLQDSQADQPPATYNIGPSPLGPHTQKQVLSLLRPLAGGGSGNQHHSTSSSPQPSGAPFLRRALPLILSPSASSSYGNRFSSATSPAATYLLPAYTPLPYSSSSSKYTRTLHGNTHRHMTGTPHRIGRVANSATNFDDSNNQPTSATSTDPMWSDTQNQEDEYQQAPQTIQITAVPNGLGVNNGFGLNGFNGGWNGWGGPAGWNGRQVLLVNRQPAFGGDWTRWIFPVLAVLALPVVLGSLLVPVFLKSVLFLIQILQMLGFLMPPSQIAGHLASNSHSPGAG